MVAPEDAAAQKSRKQDVAILNFALSLEYLQDSFYTEVERLGRFRGPLGRQARVVGAHERAHVVACARCSGGSAIKRGRYDFRGATEGREAFRRTAVAFEDLAVAAYKGQAPRIANTAYLVAALGIHTVEARHAAWIRRLADRTPRERVRRAALAQEHARRGRVDEVRRAEEERAIAGITALNRLTTGFRG